MAAKKKATKKPAAKKKTTTKKKTRFFLNRGFDNCIAVYTPDGWERMLEAIREFSPGDPKARAFKRAFLMDAMEVTVDPQGRVTIPPALITHAAIGKEAILHGADTHIEIWNPERFTALTQKVVQTEGDYEGLADALFRRKS